MEILTTPTKYRFAERPWSGAPEVCRDVIDPDGVVRVGDYIALKAEVVEIDDDLVEKFRSREDLCVGSLHRVECRVVDIDGSKFNCIVTSGTRLRVLGCNDLRYKCKHIIEERMIWGAIRG